MSTTIKLLFLLGLCSAHNIFALVSVQKGSYNICAYWPTRYKRPTLSFNFKSRSALLVELTGNQVEQLKQGNGGNYLVSINVKKDQVRKRKFQAELTSYKKCSREKTLFRITDNFRPYGQ